MANSQSHIRKIADIKTTYNEGRLYIIAQTIKSITFWRMNKPDFHFWTAFTCWPFKWANVPWLRFFFLFLWMNEIDSNFLKKISIGEIRVDISSLESCRNTSQIVNVIKLEINLKVQLKSIGYYYII
jgi:hypothetical protein